jgi:hypothetical protein
VIAADPLALRVCIIDTVALIVPSAVGVTVRAAVPVALPRPEDVTL